MFGFLIFNVVFHDCTATPLHIVIFMVSYLPLNPVTQHVAAFSFEIENFALLEFCARKSIRLREYVKSSSVTKDNDARHMTLCTAMYHDMNCMHDNLKYRGS